MKKLFALLLALVMVLSMTACGGGRTEPAPAATTPAEKPAEANSSTEAPAAAGGFEADATIGVSLPWLGTQNWKEAEEMFKTELEAAGFKPIIQAADNKVPTQQQQIESMIQNGAKVIVVGPIDGTQLGAVLEEAKAAGVYVIGYDRLLENTTGVDGIVQFGSVKTGEPGRPCVMHRAAVFPV